jgi:hypothetical protein
MAVQKLARKFGGRPVTREPEPGKRAHLAAAVPLPLKQRVETAARARGWSVSNETAFRIELGFMFDKFDQAKLIDLLATAEAVKAARVPGLLGSPEEIEAYLRRKKK